jgi:hypothetical protein
MAQNLLSSESLRVTMLVEPMGLFSGLLLVLVLVLVLELACAA